MMTLRQANGRRRGWEILHRLKVTWWTALCGWRKVHGGQISVGYDLDKPTSAIPGGKFLRPCPDCERIAKKREGKKYEPWPERFSPREVICGWDRPKVFVGGEAKP